MSSWLLLTAAAGDAGGLLCPCFGSRPTVLSQGCFDPGAPREGSPAHRSQTSCLPSALRSSRSGLTAIGLMRAEAADVTTSSGTTRRP